jgi:hypothetical protein
VTYPSCHRLFCKIIAPAAPALLALVFLYVLNGPTALAGSPPPHVPLSWEQYISIDQDYNVIGRKAGALSTDEKRIQPIFHWDIPEKNVQKYISKFIDFDTVKMFQIRKKGKRYVRLFMAKESFTDYTEMVKHFGEPEPQVYWGTRLQSKGTYFVWNPKEKNESPYFVKMQREFNGQSANHWVDAKTTVHMNDLIEETIQKGAGDGTKGTILPERFGASISSKDGKFTYAMSTRMVRPLQASADGSQLYPAHGLLGSPRVRGMQEIWGMREEDWILNQYIPAVAKLNASMNVKNHTFIEGHTQNLILEMNPGTGKVARADYRDLGDTMIDVVSAKMDHLNLNLKPEDVSLGVVNESWREFGETANRPGRFFTQYGAQALASFTADADVKKRAKIIAKYYREYIRTSEEILQQKLVLPEHVKNLLNALEDRSISDSQLLDELSYRVQPWVSAEDLKKYSALWLTHDPLSQGIYETILASKFEKIRPTLKRFPEMQSALNSAFQHADSRRNFPFLKEPGQTPVEYAWDEGGIWAVKSSDGSLVGYAYQLPPEELKKIKRASLLQKIGIEKTLSCVPFLKQLFPN